MSVDDVANHLYSDSPGAPEVVITRIFADGPARKAGLEVGDVIRSVNGVRVRNSLALVELKDRIGVGERVDLAVRRGDRDLRLSLTAERGPGPGAPMAQGAGRP
jgi:S1-C subfamily serine protease